MTFSDIKYRKYILIFLKVELKKITNLRNIEIIIYLGFWCYLGIVI